LTIGTTIEVNPVAQIREPKVDKPLIRVYTDEDLRRLDAACDRTPKGSSITPDERKALAARDRAIIWLFLSTGIRASELCGLLFSDIDWDAGLIYVRGKGAKERRVPFGKVARQHLNTYIQYWRGVPARNEDEHVFLNVFGIPMRLQSIQQLFKRLKKVSGITDKRVSAHTCRHWFAVNCIKRGMPSTVLQGLLGHEHLEMINVYVKLAEQDSRALYVQYSPVDALEMHHSAKGRREQAREWRNARKRKGANK
jgi:site-specific recombinase XerD